MISLYTTHEYTFVLVSCTSCEKWPVQIKERDLQNNNEFLKQSTIEERKFPSDDLKLSIWKWNCDFVVEKHTQTQTQYDLTARIYSLENETWNLNCRWMGLCEMYFISPSTKRKNEKKRQQSLAPKNETYGCFISVSVDHNSFSTTFGCDISSNLTKATNTRTRPDCYHTILGHSVMFSPIYKSDIAVANAQSGAYVNFGNI